MKKQEATLENWSLYNNGKQLQGEVYNHPHFEKGVAIVTSLIVNLNVTKNEAETLNTKYKLGKKNE